MLDVLACKSGTSSLLQSSGQFRQGAPAWRSWWNPERLELPAQNRAHSPTCMSQWGSRLYKSGAPHQNSKGHPQELTWTNNIWSKGQQVDCHRYCSNISTFVHCSCHSTSQSGSARGCRAGMESLQYRGLSSWRRRWGFAPSHYGHSSTSTQKNDRDNWLPQKNISWSHGAF